MDDVNALTQLRVAFDYIEALCEHPNAALFREHEQLFIELEKIVSRKTLFDASFAFAADQAEAGDKVGSSRTVDYFMKVFDLDWWEANSRIDSGRLMYGTPRPAPDPAPGPAPDPEDDASAEDESQPTPDSGDEDQPSPEPDPEPNPNKSGRRKNITPQKRRMLEREINQLHHSKAHLAASLFAEGLEEATRRDLKDLERWIRARVRSINAGVDDPEFAWSMRGLRWSRPNAQGQVKISGTTTAEVAALLESLLANSLRPKNADGKKDVRTLSQRRHDGFFDLLKAASQFKAGKTGAASVVLSVTPEDLEQIERYLSGEEIPVPEFPTNTNYMLSLYGLARLGLTETVFTALLDGTTGLPLHLGRSKRLASSAQWLALFASQGVCAHPGCDQPACNCDVHHLRAWRNGGETNIDNLTFVCRGHHGSVNDDHNGRGHRGHFEREKATGDVAWKPPPTRENPHPEPEINDSLKARQYPGGKIRSRHREQTRCRSYERERAGSDRAAPDGFAGQSEDPPF